MNKREQRTRGMRVLLILAVALIVIGLAGIVITWFLSPEGAGTLALGAVVGVAGTMAGVLLAELTDR